MLDEKREKAVEEKKKWISLTGLCNNWCIFCLDGDRTDRFHKSEKEIKKQIDEGIKEKATRLVLSGGEPTIHPKILDFIKYGRQIGYKKIQIITNGRMLAYASFVDALKNAGLSEVTFSIHGHTKKLHESMTGVPGSFAQIVQGIKNANEAGFIVNSDTVITKINYKYLPEILEFVHSLRINEVNLMSIVPFGNAWKNTKEVIYKFEDIVPYVNKAIDFCKSKGIFLWFSRFPAEYLEGHEEYIESSKKILEDVLARGENFFKKQPDCLGEKCEYCGIKTVCSNLLLGTYTKLTPPCIIFPKIKIDKQIISKGDKSFKDFSEEICENSKVKRISCKRCIFNDSCEGILREDARKNGFGVITPIIKEEIRINLDCNQNCIFCNTDKNSENFILDNQRIIEKIKEWAKQGVNYIVITGKEPTMHKKLAEFIKTAKECGYKKIELQTNALAFSNNAFLERMQDAGLTHAFVSFHSPHKSTYNKITNSKTFDKAVKGIKNLCSSNIKITVNTVINELNYKKLPELIDYIYKNFSVEGIVLSFVAPVCNALNHKWIIPRISETVLCIKEAIERCNKYNINCRIPSRCGIPVCFMLSFAGHFDEIKEPTRWANSNDKIKYEKCNICSFNDSCNGLWQEYVRIHGFK